MLTFSTTLWKLITHLRTVSPNYISTTSMVLFFKSLYFHLSCIYTEGLRPFLLILYVQGSRVHSGCEQSKVNLYACMHLQCGAAFLCPSPLSLSSLTFTHTHLHKHIFSFWRWQLPNIWRICSPVSSYHFTCAVFFFFLTFFSHFLFLPPSSPGPSITLQRSRSCHLHV